MEFISFKGKESRGYVQYDQSTGAKVSKEIEVDFRNKIRVVLILVDAMAAALKTGIICQG